VAAARERGKGRPWNNQPHPVRFYEPSRMPAGTLFRFRRHDPGRFFVVLDSGAIMRLEKYEARYGKVGAGAKAVFRAQRTLGLA